MTAEDILAMLNKARAQTAALPASSMTFESLADYGLDNVDCPICGNSGWNITRGEGPLEIHAKECICMKQRYSLRNIKNSGMADLLERYTLDNYVADTEQRRRVLTAAMRFLESPTGWFYIAGQSGSGKTHICTGICSGLIKQGKSVRFVSWRDEAVALKALVTERGEYEERIGKLKKIPVLYIDDFFKGKITDADINLAFEIINARYNDQKLRTVISSEIDIRKVLELDEAVGGRIYERAKGFMVQAPPENWRLRKAREDHP